jgi:hypothetical protein
MREIKVKLWSNVFHRFINLEEEAFEIDCCEGQIIFGIYNDDVEYHDLIPLQYIDKKDKSGVDVYTGDILKIYRDEDKYKNLFGEIKQLEGGQYYIDHKKVSLKYQHQIHCEVCDAESPVFFLDYFESYEIEIIGNVFQNPALINALNQQGETNNG